MRMVSFENILSKVDEGVPKIEIEKCILSIEAMAVVTKGLLLKTI